MAGFLASGGSKTAKEALEYYSQALDILQWGRSIWGDVPRETRGTMFDVTFIRGVRRLFLSAFVEVRRDLACKCNIYRMKSSYRYRHVQKVLVRTLNTTSMIST